VEVAWKKLHTKNFLWRIPNFYGNFLLVARGREQGERQVSKTKSYEITYIRGANDEPFTVLAVLNEGQVRNAMGELVASGRDFNAHLHLLAATVERASKDERWLVSVRPEARVVAIELLEGSRSEARRAQTVLEIGIVTVGA
jgi:hypothetical protein